MWEPKRVYEIPLWDVNHSANRLRQEQRLDYTAYVLGYEMKEEVDSPESKAYKFFSDDYYPKGNITRMGYQTDKPVALCCDFNRAPHAWALAQKIGEDRYLVFDEIWSDDALTREQAIKCVARLKDWGIKSVVLYGDNTSNQRAGRYGRHGRNDWQVVKQHLSEGGIDYDSSKLRKQNPKRKVRVDTVNNIIYAGTDEHGDDIRRLLVHEDCKKVIRDYNFSIVDDDGLKVDDGDKGHISDAVDYFIYEDQKGAKGLTYIL